MKCISTRDVTQNIKNTDRERINIERRCLQPSRGKQLRPCTRTQLALVQTRTQEKTVGRNKDAVAGSNKKRRKKKMILPEKETRQNNKSDEKCESRRRSPGKRNI